MRCPPQIICAVVVSRSVAVGYLVAFWRRAVERMAYDAMKAHRSGLSSPRQIAENDYLVALLRVAGAKNPTAAGRRDISPMA